MITTISPRQQALGFGHFITRNAFGVVIAVGITGLAALLHHLGLATTIGLPILSILIAMVIGNAIPAPKASLPGLQIASRPLLRFGIILLGLQVTLGDMLALGLLPLAALVALVMGTMGFTVWVGRLLGVEKSLTVLIASGTSICGASAVLATASTISAKDEDVAYGVAMVTLFGSVAMTLLPMTSAYLNFGPMVHGFWTGGTIHEVAQAVAAAFQHNEDAGAVGTMVKLARVLMLVPVLLLVGALFNKGHQDASSKRAPFPMFVLGFMAMVGVNSVLDIPADLRAHFATLTACILATSLAAIGFQTRFPALLARGPRPLVLAAVSCCFVSGAGLLLALALFP
ncbi:putative sulfate exporter family transporter [Roseovarius mucosus]|uniref:YeiH family protein n=1 Tax=Roseovarius mucosus TaxID=215743 RepID=UPI001C5D42EA|nr:putative sulfate exporter family transporter [Roseovarius mucosus]MBW4974124.1 putative sulfate exporter family transporter [Roseovarius mucosus]